MIVKITEHDHNIEKIADSVQSLAKSLETTGKLTNSKLDNIVEALSRQAVLMEQIKNLETRFNEGSSRLHGRIETLEDLATTTIKNRDIRGCQYGRESQIKLENLEKTVVKNLEIRIGQLEDSRTWIVRVVIGKIILLALSAIVYLAKA